MEQFGIDLDKVLNDFEEQENKKEIENLKASEEGETRDNVFHVENIVHHCQSRINESTSEAKLSKNCLPSTNDILSSLNKYCKHFLRENVANHVCCNDSRFLDNSPSQDAPSPESEDICEDASSVPTEELDLIRSVDKELLVLSSLNEAECEATNSYVNGNICCSQEFPIGPYICIENAKLATAKDGPSMILVNEEQTNRCEASSVNDNLELVKCNDSSKPLSDDSRGLSLVDAEVLPANKSKDTGVENYYKERTVLIHVNSDDEPSESSESGNKINQFFTNEIIKEITLDNHCPDVTNACRHEAEELIIQSPTEQPDKNLDSSFENSVVNVPTDETADVKHYGHAEPNDLPENAIEQNVRVDYPSKDSDLENLNDPLRDVTSEETFVNSSELNIRGSGAPDVATSFIGVEEFNLSDDVDEDKTGKNGKYQNGNDDDDDEALNNLKQEAAEFMEEMKNGDIVYNSEDLTNHDYTLVLENINDSLTNENLWGFEEKLDILHHDDGQNLSDESSRLTNCLSTLAQEQVQEIDIVPDDSVLLDDAKSDDQLITGILRIDIDKEILEDLCLVQDGNLSSEKELVTTHPQNLSDAAAGHDPSMEGDMGVFLYHSEQEDGSLLQISSKTFQNFPTESPVEIPKGSEDREEMKVSTVSSRRSTRPTHPGSLQFTQPQFFHAPSRCSNIDLPITELGKVSPTWLPDSSTTKCLQCETSFSFLRRRHHCRACGLVFCNECCNVRHPLEYMNRREERVCCKCFVDFNRASSYQNMLSSMSASTHPPPQPNPNNSSEYCSTISPPLQATPSDPLPPIMVPTGVLRKHGVTRQQTESKQVMFSDGIRPGGDLTHLDERPEGASSGGSKKKKSVKSVGSLTLSKKQASRSSKSASNQSSPFWVEGRLPPMVVYSDEVFRNVLDKATTPEEAFKRATDDENKLPVMFCLNASLFVHLKVIKKMCCVKRDVWCFSSQGMTTVGQDEVVILMEFNQSETSIPVDIFHAINHVYNSARGGTPINNMGSIILPMNGTSHEVCGFLFVRQTIQCVQNIFLPDAPYLFGIYIKQVELTWARAFPLRLFLRLGAEFRYYPCPLFGVRERRPVYGEIGHTIMNLLADFRNFQYSLSTVDDLVIHVEEKQTTILIPRHKHHQMLKALSDSDDHVLALAGNVSLTADSHLVCMQNPEGSYQTQAMNIQGKSRRVTGASFVVFNGALKVGSGYRAKMSIIEDGLMVQITPEDMASLKHALSSANDFTIRCGLSSSATQPSSPGGGEGVFDGVVSATWFSEHVEKSSDLRSPIDNLNLSRLECKRIHSSLVHLVSGEGFAITWTGLFFLNQTCASPNLRPEIERFSDTLASSCCITLTPHIASLFPPLFSKLSLRVKVSPDQIGYEARINESQLNDECLVALDNVIIPLLHGSSFAACPYDTSLELLFVVTKPINA